MKNIRMFREDGKLVVHKQTDPTAALESAASLRANEGNLSGQDYWHVGRLDAHVVEMWAKEAGVKFDDRAAVAEVIRRKLLSGDASKFRVRQGTF